MGCGICIHLVFWDFSGDRSGWTHPLIRFIDEVGFIDSWSLFVEEAMKWTKLKSSQEVKSEIFESTATYATPCQMQLQLKYD